MEIASGIRSQWGLDGGIVPESEQNSGEPAAQLRV